MTEPEESQTATMRAPHDELRRLRKVRFVRAAWSGIALRAVNITVQVISLGMTVRYLGPERYGMWATMSTFVAWFSLANVGLGNGLIARLSLARGRGDAEAADRYVNSTLAMVTAI